MIRLSTIAIIIIYNFGNMLACSPIFSSYCETTQLSNFLNKPVFAGEITAKNENNITLNILERLRGEESETTITVWDGPYYDNLDDPICPHVSSGFTKQYGEVGDTIFCILELIEEELTDHDVIGDYRRPSTWTATTFLQVINGMAIGYDYYGDLNMPYEDFISYACHENVYGCADADACNYNSSATVDDESCYYDCEKPQVSCPTDEFFICEPSEVPPLLSFEDFQVSDNTTPTDEIYFRASERTTQYNQYKLHRYEYFFADEFGNFTRCYQRYYIPDDVILPPTIEPVIDICENTESVIIEKPMNDNYYFYADRNGSPGEQIGSCTCDSASCFSDNLGINTTQVGSYKIWVTKAVKRSCILEGKSWYRCESEAVPLTVNVRPASPDGTCENSTCENPLNLDIVKNAINEGCTDLVYALGEEQIEYLYINNTCENIGQVYECSTGTICTSTRTTLVDESCAFMPVDVDLTFAEDKVVWAKPCTYESIGTVKKFEPANFDDFPSTFYYVESDHGEYVLPLRQNLMVDQVGKRIKFTSIESQSLKVGKGDDEFPVSLIICFEPVDDENMTELFENYPWLDAFFRQQPCSDGTQVSQYPFSTHNFLYVEWSHGKNELYFQDGTYYCEDEDCLNALGLNNATGSWTINDLYACESRQETIFNNYSWLSNFIDSENCRTGAQIKVYPYGSYSFVYVQKVADERGALYFQDGTLYCEDTPNYSCLSIYNLDNETLVWACENEDTNPRTGTSFIGGVGKSPPETIQSDNERLTFDANCKVYPNPSKGEFTIELAQSFPNGGVISISNLQGKKLKEISLSEAEQYIQISLPDASSGLYLMHIRSENLSTSQKLLIR